MLAMKGYKVFDCKIWRDNSFVETQGRFQSPSGISWHVSGNYPPPPYKHQITWGMLPDSFWRKWKISGRGVISV